MAAAQSAPAPPILQAPVHRFERYEAAVQAIALYEAGLHENAVLRRSSGLNVTDQDRQVEAFCLLPARPLQPPLVLIGGMGPAPRPAPQTAIDDQPPLVLIGGMGPWAGAMAFRRACERFRDSRTVVLYQACNTPDRSTVILREDGPDTPLCREMALRLADAVRLGVDLAGPAIQPARCIVACNSAHYFWRLLEDDLRQSLPGRECQVRMISLVDSCLEAIQSQSCRRTLLLATEGARVGQVFSAPFREAGIAFEEPSPALGLLLMRAIFEGVKAVDERRAVELGNAFFEAILQTGRDYDCILAGCTELPLTIDLLRLRGSPAVAAFLSRVRIVDPMEEAVSRA
jgi:aspartate/glutamate racemase